MIDRRTLLLLLLGSTAYTDAIRINAGTNPSLQLTFGGETGLGGLEVYIGEKVWRFTPEEIENLLGQTGEDRL